MTSIDIILPLYNPIDGWEHQVYTRYRELQLATQDIVNTHLVLVNDGSTLDIENALQVLKKSIPNILIINYSTNRGKGFALREGLRQSKSPYVLFTDHDFPYETESSARMVRYMIENNLALIIAQRDKSYYDNIKIQRHYVSVILKFLNKKLLGLPISDTQGGLKGFNAEVRSIFLNTSTDRYLIDVEFLKKAHKKGHRITPLNVKLREEITLTKVSNMKIIKEFFDYVKIILS